MSKAGKLVKDMLKAKKESVMGKLGDSPYEDPMEPWSAKYAQPVKEESEQLDESDPVLFKYIRSLGYNPEQMDFATRSKYARSNNYKNYKISHLNDNLSEEELDEAGTGLLMSYIKAKGLNPLSMDGNQKKSYSRSSEFRLFKNRHVKEISGMGERGEDWNEASSPAQQAAIAINMQKKGIKPKNMKEEADAKDTVCFDIPLLIRVLEFTREDMKTDIELHNMVERLINMRHDVPLTMEHYDAITGKLKESVSYEPNTGRQTKTGAGHTIVGHSFHANGTKHANILKHGETGKYFAANGSSSHPTKTTTFHDSPEEAAKSKKSYVKEEKDRGEYDYEGAMAKTQLQTICRNAEALKDMLEDDENLPEWVQAKITKAEDYITTSLDYLKSTEELDEEVVNELSKNTLKSYVDKVTSTTGRGMTPKGTLKSIKSIGGVTKAIRKQYEKPLSELKKQDDNQELDSHITREDLRKWFSKTDPEGDWKRINSKGDAVGPCAREPGEPKPKCMSKEKRAELSKSERAAAVATKRRNDPVADRPGKGGKPINVSNYGKGKLSEDNVDEACWDNYKQVGTKMKGDKVVPNCVPKNEEAEQMDEKNSPTNPALWSRAKTMARSKFDVYPSAYANGWASKWYKSKGGGWKSVKEDVVQEGIGGIEDSPMSATNSVKAMESEHRKKNMKSARIIKSIYKKKGKNESMYDWEKDDKGGKTPTAKITLQGGTTMTGKPRDTVEIEPVLKTRPNSQKQ